MRLTRSMPTAKGAVGSPGQWVHRRLQAEVSLTKVAIKGSLKADDQAAIGSC